MIPFVFYIICKTDKRVNAGKYLRKVNLTGDEITQEKIMYGGATMSLRLDSLGKSMGSAVMRMKIHINEGEI